MKILITGAEGRVGGVVRKALKDDHELILLDRRDPVESYCRRGTSGPFRTADISDFCSIAPHFEGVDTVIHLAANPSPTAPWHSLAENNVTGTRNVYEAAARAGVRRMIYASSIHVYPYPTLYYEKQRIIGETSTRAENHYGLSKIIGESIGLNYHRLHGMSVVNLRLGSVSRYGRPSQSLPQGVRSLDYAIWMGHDDLKEIVRAAVGYEGYVSLCCVSANEENFVDLAPITQALGVVPRLNSADFKGRFWLHRRRGHRHRREQPAIQADQLG